MFNDHFEEQQNIRENTGNYNINIFEPVENTPTIQSEMAILQCFLPDILSSGLDLTLVRESFGEESDDNLTELGNKSNI